MAAGGPQEATLGRAQPDTRPSCERNGGQLRCDGHLGARTRSPYTTQKALPQGPLRLLQLSGHLKLAFLRPRAPILGR